MIIVNNDERLIVVKEFKLFPGCNEVDTKIWEECKKEYNLKELFDNKKLEEINEEFNKLDLETKEKILNGTFSLKTLENWKNKEPNDSIRGQIVDRIKGIKEADIKITYADPNKRK